MIDNILINVRGRSDVCQSNIIGVTRMNSLAIEEPNARGRAVVNVTIAIDRESHCSLCALITDLIQAARRSRDFVDGQRDFSRIADTLNRLVDIDLTDEEMIDAHSGRRSGDS